MRAEGTRPVRIEPVSIRKKDRKKSELDPLDAEKSAGYKYDLPPKRWLTNKLEVA
jgi:hypothetical protein